MADIPPFTWFYTSQVVVWDFSHQQKMFFFKYQLTSYLQPQRIHTNLKTMFQQYVPFVLKHVAICVFYFGIFQIFPTPSDEEKSCAQSRMTCFSEVSQFHPRVHPRRGVSILSSKPWDSFFLLGMNFDGNQQKLLPNCGM